MAKTPKQRVGSRAQVMRSTAEMTSGGLRKRDLKYNKNGRIVSRKRSQRAKREKRLEKAGYKTQKGVFGAVKQEAQPKTRSKKRSSKRSNKKRSKKSSVFSFF
jgi:hypothetical protein